MNTKVKTKTFFIISVLLTIVSLYQGFHFFKVVIGLIPALIISFSFECARITALWAIRQRKKLLQSAILYAVVAPVCAFSAVNSFIIESHERESIAIEAKKVTDLEIFKERARVGAVLSLQYDEKIQKIELIIDGYRQKLAKRDSDYYENRIIDREKEIDSIRQRLKKLLAGSLDKMYYESGETPREVSANEKSSYSRLVAVIAARWNLPENHVIFLIALLITAVIEIGIITAAIMSVNHESDHVTEKKSPVRRERCDRSSRSDNGVSDYEKFSRIVEEKGFVPAARETNPNLREARKEYINRSVINE